MFAALPDSCTNAPKPRGIAGIARDVLGWMERVSAHEDSMAVDGVWGELVSGVRSLLSRENTGNFSDFRPLESN